MAMTGLENLSLFTGDQREASNYLKHEYYRTFNMYAAPADVDLFPLLPDEQPVVTGVQNEGDTIVPAEMSASRGIDAVDEHCEEDFQGEGEGLIMVVPDDLEVEVEVASVSYTQ